jgi:hypothetical protein
MSDEHEERRDPAGRPAQPDETRPFSPFTDDDDATSVSRNHPDGDPRSSDAWVLDRSDDPPNERPDGGPTEQLPRADDPTVITPRPDDPTAVAPRAGNPAARNPAGGTSRPGETSIMPPVGGEPAWGAAEAPWSGRAEVRPPRPGEYAADDWATEPPPEPRGKWWMPIVIGIVGLILLALLGWGIWLIARSEDSGGGNPAPAATTPVAVPTTAAPAPTTVAPTSAAPTTAATTAEPTPSEVTIPALRGLSRDEAQQALTRRGLSSRLRYRNSTDAPPGTVIDSDPAEGQEVPPDTVVTLVIAAEPQASATPSASATAQSDDD